MKKKICSGINRVLRNTGINYIKSKVPVNNVDEYALVRELAEDPSRNCRKELSSK